MVNVTLLNFGKRYDDYLRVIFDQWLKLHLGLDALSHQKILKGISYTYSLGKYHGKRELDIRACFAPALRLYDFLLSPLGTLYSSPIKRLLFPSIYVGHYRCILTKRV